MEKNKVIFALILILTITIVGAGLSIFFGKFIHFGEVKIPTRPAQENVSATGPTGPTPRLGGGLAYAPATPQDAPAPMKEAVMLGYHIVTDPQKYAAQYAGNKLKCSNCHFKGGITEGGRNGGISLVGVAAGYPAYEQTEGSMVDLAARTNRCFQTSLNGRPLPPQSREMAGVLAYFHWISKGLPIYGKIPWLGLKPIPGTHAPDKGQGAQMFARKCSACHGSDGKGTQVAPPLWGPQSFNDGAGMARPENLSAFTYLNMPPGNPDSTEEQALDVGIFVATQPRPHFSLK